MGYTIYTVGTPMWLITLVGNGAHDGTVANLRPHQLDEIVSTARRRAREAGYQVRRESLLRDPDNCDGPQVHRMVAEALDREFQLAHQDRQLREMERAKQVDAA